MAKVEIARIEVETGASRKTETIERKTGTNIEIKVAPTSNKQRLENNKRCR